MGLRQDRRQSINAIATRWPALAVYMAVPADDKRRKEYLSLYPPH